MPSTHRAGGDDGLPSDNEFGSAALHMSTSEIDQYLMAGASSKRLLWIPDGLSTRGGGGGHYQPANGHAQPGGAAKPSHGIGPPLSWRSPADDTQHRYTSYLTFFDVCVCVCGACRDML